MDELNSYTQILIDLAPQIFSGLLVLIIGLKIIALLKRRFDHFLEQRNYDQALKSFVIATTDITLKIALFISVASMWGVQTTSFLAVLGSAGLAVGLALQGSLANFAGGVMLLIFRPFKAGHYIETQGFQGTVKQLTIFHTVLSTPDNRRIVLPNGNVANSPLINFSAEDRRRIDLTFSISYKDNIGIAKKIILEAIESDPRVLKDPAPMVMVTKLGDSSVDLVGRAWTLTGDFWPYTWDNTEKIKILLEEGGITIPFPQRDVHLIKES